jgi:hypothetical protein
MNIVQKISNSATVTTTTLYNDLIYFTDYDRLEIGTTAKGDPLINKEIRAGNSVVTSVAAAVADTVLLAFNILRLGGTVFNDSTAIMYLKLGTGASTTSYTTQVARNGYYEIPFGYIGPMNAYWTAATGNARVTELT